jgi:hypothetical protein
MQKIRVSIPDQLALRMRVSFPSRQRNKIILHLIEAEVEKREHCLYECAAAVEKNEALSKEMQEWNITLSDGLSQ